MEKRKRLSDIGRQSRIKIRKQEDKLKLYCDRKTNYSDEMDFVATSFNKTGHYLRSNDFKTGQEFGVFTNAVIHVNTCKQLTESSTLSARNQIDIETCTKDHLQNDDTKNNRAYVRDDSGYISEDFSETTSNPDVCDADKEFVFQQERVSKDSTSVEDVKQMLEEEKVEKCQTSFTKVKESESGSANKEVVVDESDEILTSECVNVITEIQNTPNAVNKRWARHSLEGCVAKYLYKNGSLKRRHSFPEMFRREKYIGPDHRASIYIQHEYADTKFGDEFGAELWTYNTHQEDGTIYKQHFLVNVKAGAPAAKMKIESDDEVILLNGSFVPDLEHSEVLELFKNVKVDGKTRFKLVLRRLVKVRSKKEWEWLETSAILAPDLVHDLDKYPEVTKEKCKLVRSNQLVTRTVHHFKTPSKEQHYLDVKDNSVVADVMTGTNEDKSKRIWKYVHLKILSGIPPKVSWKASLYCEINSKFIVIDSGNQIKLDETPMYFDIEEVGDDISFKINGQYLSCNNTNLKIEPSNCEYRFTQLPADYGVDQVDHSMQMALSCDASSCRFTTLRRSISSHNPCKTTCVSDNSKYITRSNSRTSKRSEENMELDTEKHGLCARKKGLTLSTTHNGSGSRSRSSKSCSEILKTPTTPLKYMCI